MRYRSAVWICVLSFWLVRTAPAAVCAVPTEACAEWLSLAKDTARVLVYRSHPLHARNAGISRALVVIHGTRRDAENYFDHALAGAGKAGALHNTLVVALRFAADDGDTCRDALHAAELNWPCGGPGRWTAGGAAHNDARFTSFDAMDHLLRQLSRKDVFPALETIVVAGHSAGGQFVARYAMANRVHEALGVAVRYVVANPSSYAYLDRARPALAPASPGGLNRPTHFAPFAYASRCATYDRWPYGLRHRVGYARRLAVHELTQQFASRPTTYLLGGQDTAPQFGFDASCPAMAQGPSRLARGLAFARYVNQQFGAHHQALVIPACGHDGRCMLGDAAARRLLFPDSHEGVTLPLQRD